MQSIYLQSIQTPSTRPPLSLRSPIDRPIDISSENNNVGGVSEPQPRRVRPLPAIPTPASTPSSGTPYASSHDVKNENNDFYDSALRIDTSGASLQAQGQESSRATKRSLRQLTIPSDHSQTTPSAGSSGSSSTPSKQQQDLKVSCSHSSLKFRLTGSEGS